MAEFFVCENCGWRGSIDSPGAGMKVISGLWHDGCGFLATPVPTDKEGGSPEASRDEGGGSGAGRLSDQVPPASKAVPLAEEPGAASTSSQAEASTGVGGGSGAGDAGARECGVVLGKDTGAASTSSRTVGPGHPVGRRPPTNPGKTTT